MARRCISIFILLVGGLFGWSHAEAQELPWTSLVPAHDSRDAEMRAWDEADTRHMIRTINQSEEFAKGHFQWARVAVADLLDAAVPFADLHFDSVHPMDFTPQEKNVLREWIERGGFLLAFEDTYPYTQEEFRKERSLPAFDFFIKELPASDPRYTVERATDQHPIFRALYPTQSALTIQREMRENPHYRGRTMLLHDGRIVAFFMGRYSYESDGRWVPLERPFAPDIGVELRSYYLMLNIYIYALNH